MNVRIRHLLLKFALTTPAEALVRWVSNQLQRLRSPQSWAYDRQTVEVMTRVLKADSSCVDVGAHVGSVLRHIIELAPAGSHIAIEPLPDLARILRKRFPSVRVHELALSDLAGESSFHHVVRDPGYSGLRPQHYPRRGATVEEIRVKTDLLDNIIPEDLDIALIKIDVEGAELLVLRGAIRTIERCKPYIVFEHGGAAASYDTTPQMIYDLLVNRCGLQISLLTDWLSEKAAMQQSEFVSSVGKDYYFLAHP